MILVHKTVARCLLGVPLILFGCKESPSGSSTDVSILASSGPQASQQAGEDTALPVELRVDPDLIEAGRIVLQRVRAPLAPGAGRVSGEVVSSPDGAAEVGALVAGRVAEVLANVGDTVTRGQILLWLDSPEVGASRADLARSAVARSLAKGRAERQKNLQQQNATTQAAAESAQAALQVAEADYAAVVLRLKALGATSGSGARYPLRSQIDGVVTERHVVLGGAVHPEEALFLVVAPERVLVVARFPQREGILPELGSRVGIALIGSRQDKPCGATVETSAQVVDPSTRTLLVRLRPDPGCKNLRQGAYVEVVAMPQNEEGQSTPSVMGDLGAVQTAGMSEVPALAVVSVRGKQTVFVAEGERGTFSARQVQLLSIEGSSALVSGKLRPGDEVVVQGTILLKGEMLRDVLGGD